VVRPGLANVVFESFTRAEEAIRKLNGMYVEGWNSPLKIEWARGEVDRLQMRDVDDTKLFVGSIPRQTEKQELDELFGRFGRNEIIHMQQKSCAFVKYDNKEDALRAIRALDKKKKLKDGDMFIEVEG
jgi:RNA recognition motif-containing protein